MKFHITLNDEDYIAFRICLCLSTPANKRMFLIGLLKSSIFYCIIFYCFLVFTERDKFTIGIFIALFVVFIIDNLISYENTSRKYIRKYIENIKKEGKLPYYTESILEFFGKEIQETSAFGVRCRKYSDVTRILRDEEHIYVMIGALEAVILPLRCLEGKENELVEFLNGKLQKNS